MIENMNDLISIIVLLCFPIFALFAFVKTKIGKREEKILRKAEKYYREW